MSARREMIGRVGGFIGDDPAHLLIENLDHMPRFKVGTLVKIGRLTRAVVGVGRARSTVRLDGPVPSARPGAEIFAVEAPVKAFVRPRKAKRKGKR